MIHKTKIPELLDFFSITVNVLMKNWKTNLLDLLETATSLTNFYQ